MTKFTFSIFLYSLVFVVTGCSQDEQILNPSEENEIDNLYYSMMEKPTISILSKANNCSRYSGMRYVPELTKEDVEYLASLSQEDFTIEQNKLLSQLENVPEDLMDEIAIDNYNNLMTYLGGQEGISKLLNFASSYLNLSGGINDIKVVLPKELRYNELEYYVAMAVYIDRVARPIYAMMVDDNKYAPVSRQMGDCKWEAETKLLLAGCEFGLDTLIEIMSGGIDTEGYVFEDAVVLADVERIYYDYEVCMGRWH